MNKQAEKRKLKSHPKLLIDVIKRQAGTLSKAILEGTMNSIEAGATGVEIDFTAEKTIDKNNPQKAYLSIHDDGIGIRTKTELIQHFETFGQPHEEHENVVWKQFRMGRGQMFAFGKNVWKTAGFEMLVDVDTLGLEYLLKEGMPNVDGCQIDIELYKNPLDNYTISSVKSLKMEVQEQVRYVKVPVMFNGEQVSVDPETLNWDFEDENAYYLFNDTSALKIYNLGVYVMSIPMTRAGVGGIVVSKKMLEVNFARNDVQSTCVVYQAIQKIVQENKIKKVSKTYKSMPCDQRINLLINLRDGEDYWELTGKRIFRTAQNKWVSWNMIKKDGRPWCFAKMGDRTADKAMESDVVLCFDKGMLDELGYVGSHNKFFTWLWSEQTDFSGQKETYENDTLKILEDLYCEKPLTEMFAEEYNTIPYAKLKKTDKKLLDFLNYLRCWDGRKIRFGKSPVAAAWTDGKTYVTFDINFVRGLNLQSHYGVMKFLAIAAHEMSHDDDSAGTHIHGDDYYERYYEITQQCNATNPLYYIPSFIKEFDKWRIEYKKAEEEQKERAALEKLGSVAASLK